MIVTNVARDAVDADALLTNSAKADGEVVWSLCPALFLPSTECKKTLLDGHLSEHAPQIKRPVQNGRAVIWPLGRGFQGVRAL